MEIGSIYEIDPNTFSDAAAYDASVIHLKKLKNTIKSTPLLPVPAERQLHWR